MKGWYRAAAKRGPPPAQATLEQITAEQTELYRRVPPPGENIPVNVDPANIYDSVPTEDEVEEAVKRLWRNRSGGPSRIRAEHIKGWLAAARSGGMAEERGKNEDGDGGGGRRSLGESRRAHTDGFQGRHPVRGGDVADDGDDT